VSDLAPLLQGFFTDKLMLQRQASPNTIAAYRDTFTLLLGFVQTRSGRHPAQLSVADLDARRSGISCNIWKPAATTPPPPATHASPRSTHSAATPSCALQNTSR
jgi:integrase family protein with SAM-like domain